MNYSNDSCSFCGKDKAFVKVVIAGPEYTLGKKGKTTRAYICNECIDVCVEILRDRKDLPDPEKLHVDK